MIKTINGVGHLVRPLVSKLCGYNENVFLNTDPAIGFMYNDELVGGVVFNNYTKDANIEQSTASKTPRVFTSKQLMFEVFSYPFLQLKVKSLVARIAETNERSIRFTEYLGFQYAGYVRYGYDKNTGLLIYDMTKEDWLNTKWLKNYIGKIS